MKIGGKKLLQIFGVLVVVFLVFWISRAAYYGYQGYIWNKKVQAFEDALTKPLREDTYGGKTPEETWAMFLEALRNKDVELASKYAYIDKRESVLGRLREAQKLDRLDLAYKQYSGSLTKDGGDYLIGSHAYYYIPIKLNLGRIENYSIVFVFNNYTNIWKISVL